MSTSEFSPGPGRWRGEAGLKIANSILDLIGNIPLVRLNRIGTDTGAEILVKPEFLNPSGSIKDRIAMSMVEAAERDGAMKPGMTIVEASTGNTGTALAMVAAVKDYEMLIVAPARVANASRLAIPLSFGAKVQTVETPSDQDGGEANVHGGRVEIQPRQVCRQMEQDRSDVWGARQFANSANVAAHRDWTAMEILDQTDGRLDAFVASVGTGGTLLGCAQALKERNPRLLVVGCEPAGKTLLAAGEAAYPIIPGITDGIIPETFRSGLVDRSLHVDHQVAIATAHRLAEEEGLFCGMSSGANVAVAVEIARELGPGKRVVTVLPDSRDRYLTVEQYTT